MPRWLMSLMLATTLCMSGCGIDFGYLLPAAGGQINLWLQSVPIEEALASGTLTDEQIAKLELIQDVRDFATERIGLNTTSTYTSFFDAGDQAVAYNVSASRKDKLEPFIWEFPIIGAVPYLGYFDEQAARDRVEVLESMGYDVYMYEIDAYSTGGFFPNPVLSPMLKREDLSLIDTVIHELSHATIWRTGDVTFNENMATFIGRQGALEYVEDRYGVDSDELLRAYGYFADLDTFVISALTLLDDLSALYESDLSEAEILRQREDVFASWRVAFAADVQPTLNDPESYEWVQRVPTNNAFILGFQRYNLNLDVFENTFDAMDHDWAQMLAALEAAAKSQDDPYNELASILE